jgi:uncharacterized protein YbjT (DUF2867 family)
MSMATTFVFGANGQVGSALVPLLRAQGQTVLRGTSKPGRQPDEVQADLATGAGLAPALSGVEQVFLMAPPGHAQHDAVLVPAIHAARSAGVRKLVLMSAMGANADDQSPLRKAELALERSGMTWAIVRPNWFMQNFHTFWLQGIQQQGQIFLPVGGAKGSFIDTRDIAAVVAVLLSSDRFDNTAHDLTGDEALDHHQVAAVLSRVTGRTIGYTDIPPDAMRAGLLGAGLPPDYAEFLLQILGFFKAGYSERITDAVQQITGRGPIRLERYAQDHRAAWA